MCLFVFSFLELDSFLCGVFASNTDYSNYLITQRRMPYCSIKWCGKCSKTSNFEKDNITFHRFPKNSKIKSQWIAATKRKTWHPTTNSVICSRHFTDDCFVPIKNRRRLLDSAVPTLFLPDLVHRHIVTRSDDANTEIQDNQTSKVIAAPQSTFTEPIDLIESSPNPDTSLSSAKKNLCRRINELTNILSAKNKQIKALRDKNRKLSVKVGKLLNRPDLIFEEENFSIEVIGVQKGTILRHDMAIAPA